MVTGGSGERGGSGEIRQDRGDRVVRGDRGSGETVWSGETGNQWRLKGQVREGDQGEADKGRQGEKEGERRFSWFLGFVGFLKRGPGNVQFFRLIHSTQQLSSYHL